ncbi:oxygenase MpaB family protein [Marisediminicola sp. LYQ134]|uniref:oxygenase MpaB family protein n=1 Tax=unclassified Marisediminicola TaxID=2618316 RepID=UPI003983395D
MGRFADSWRSHLLTTLSGNDEGRPHWVAKIEQGDDAGFFGPGSAAWAVHGGMPTMVAGIRALLMQTLHPGAMAGVHDWSRYRDDPLGRLSGTIQWLITVTFADTTLATVESGRVGRFHDRVVGTYLDANGVEKPYAAGDPELLSWVHVVFTDAFLSSHELWGGPIPGGADRYVSEWSKAGELVGVSDPPRSRAELASQLDSFRDRGILKTDERVAEAVRFIRNPPLRPTMMPFYRIMFAGAAASLPDHYREMLGLRRSRLPAVWATGVILRLVRGLLGESSTSEDAARARIARIRSSRREPSDGSGG